MARKIFITALALILISPVMMARDKDSTRVRLNHYSFTIGAGWSHFIDNLDNGNSDITKDFAAVSAKFYWEPEHLLSLGLETGYYKLFRTTHEIGADTTVNVNRCVIPLLLLVRMRIIDHFYLGAGVGIAILTNKTEGIGKEIKTSINSLSNMEVSASYVYPLSKHWLVGGEAKVYHFGKYNDWMYSIQATCAFKL